MAVSLDHLIAQFEDLIRQGQPERVREALVHLKVGQVPRSDLASLANIARRVGRPQFALRLLHPIVRPKIAHQEPATHRELAIYASALARIGAPDEAIQILYGIASDDSPETLLFLSFAHIYKWNYAAASQSLRKYVRCQGITDYEAIIGKLNLAAAYQFTGKTDEKWALLQEILEKTEKKNWIRLRGNALELAGQAAITKGDWEAAGGYLNEARKLHPVHESDLALRKWGAILNLKRFGPEPHILDELRRVRSEAANLQRWEAVRDCDFHLAVAQQDQELAHHLYFGTRHAHYRRYIEEACREWTRMPEQYRWKLGGPGAVHSFDLLSRTDQEGRASLVSLKSVSRLLQVLASDFYAPVSLGMLFAQVYPGEYFDALHSIARVRRLIERLRIWMKENHIPLDVDVREGLVRLRAKQPYDLIAFEGQSTDTEGQQAMRELDRLKQVFPYKGFSVRDASAQLNVSVKKVRGLLLWAQSERKVYCSGKGRATRYRFAK